MVNPMFHQDVLKLVIAAVLSIFVGIEREMKRKPLGLKTCLVISVTSCLLTIVSMDVSISPLIDLFQAFDRIPEVIGVSTQQL